MAAVTRATLFVIVFVVVVVSGVEEKLVHQVGFVDLVDGSSHFASLPETEDEPLPLNLPASIFAEGDKPTDLPINGSSVWRTPGISGTSSAETIGFAYDGNVLGGFLFQHGEEVALFSKRTGKPLWSINGTKVGVDTIVASNEQARIGVIVEVQPANTCVLRALSTRFTKSLWTKTFTNCQVDPSNTTPLSLAKNGKTVIFGFTQVQQSGYINNVSFVVLAVSNGAVLLQESFQGGLTRTFISADGSKAGVLSGFSAFVYDVHRRFLIANITSPTSGALSSAALSDDGAVVAIGSYTLYVYQLSDPRAGKSKFNLLFNTAYGGYFLVQALTFANHGQSLVVGWGDAAGYQQSALSVYSLIQIAHPTGPIVTYFRPAWNFTFPSTQSSLQDCVSDLAVNDYDEDMFVLSRWGTASPSTNPNVFVFKISFGPTPLFYFGTVGSVFSVDLVTFDSGLVGAALGSKTTHANVGGSGLVELVVFPRILNSVSPWHPHAHPHGLSPEASIEPLDELSPINE